MKIMEESRDILLYSSTEANADTGKIGVVSGSRWMA